MATTYSAVVAADAEAHIAVACGDFEHPQQGEEIGIRAVVADHETRVGRVLTPERSERHRVRVPARVAIGLEHVNIVIGDEEAGSHQAADPGTDDGNLHIDSTAAPRGGDSTSSQLSNYRQRVADVTIGSKL